MITTQTLTRPGWLAHTVDVKTQLNRGHNFLTLHELGDRSGNPALLDRVFRTVVGFLEEGSLEARTHGKRILMEIHRLVGRDDFGRLVCRTPGVLPTSLTCPCQHGDAVRLYVCILRFCRTCACACVYM